MLMNTIVDRILNVLAGNTDPEICQELQRPDSDASRVMKGIQASIRNADNVDLAAVGHAVAAERNEVEDEPSGVSRSEQRYSTPAESKRVPRPPDKGGSSVPDARPIIFHATVAAATLATVPRLNSVQLNGYSTGGPTVCGRIEWWPDIDDLDAGTHRWCFVLRFPRRAIERSHGNSPQSLAYFDGREVCVAVCASGTEQRQTTKLFLDDHRDLVSAKEHIVLPRSLTEMECIRVTEVAPRKPHVATVSFPWIGAPLPDIRAFDRPADFVEIVDREPPDWIFHLSVSQTDKATYSGFPPVGDGELARYVDRLRLRMLDGRMSGYLIQPREFMFGSVCPRGHCSEYVFSLPSIVTGKSYGLAIVVGLLAAATGQPVPPWMMFTGGLHPSSLELTWTSCIAQKLRLALDVGTSGGNHNRLLAEYYRHDRTADYLGDIRNRTVPGKVRLFFVPTKLDIDLEAQSVPFAVESIPGGGEALRHASYSELEKTVDELRDGGMLVTQVSNAFEALALLGYDELHPYIQEQQLQQKPTFPTPVFRVRATDSGCRSCGVTLADTACEALRGREHWDHVIATQLDDLDDRLSETQNTVSRLQLILEWVIAAAVHDGHAKTEDVSVVEAEHFTGDVSVIDSEDQPGRWLRVVATLGDNGDCLPYFVPRDVGLVGRIMRTGKTAAVPATQEDADLIAAVESESLLASRYGYESLHRYKAFLKSVSSSLHVPLKHGSQVVGVVSLHCHRHKDFQPGFVRLVEKIAKRAAVEVAFYLGAQESRTTPSEGLGSNEELARELAVYGGRPEAALGKFCQDLMTVIMRQTGACRVGIRLLTPERRTLVDQGHMGYWKVDELSEEVHLSEDTAGGHAVKSGKSYYINDTTQAYVEHSGKCVPVHYRPCQPEARSHASVLVRHGSHLMGVVGVDWDYPGAIDSSTRQTLEQLADRYAVALKAVAVDSLWGLVYCQAPGEDSRKQVLPDLNVLLDAVSHMVGAQQGAVFLRNRDTGRYHLAASMNHRDWSQDDHWYEPGEGVTGWILRYNRPLRIANLTDSSELNAIDPSDPPVWKDKVYDGLVRNDRNWTYLGVPISVGNEVLGVLRLANGVDDFGFTSYEQVIAMAAAAQLAGLLYEQTQARRAKAVKRLMDDAFSARSTKEVFNAAFEGLQAGLGTCACAVMLADSEDARAANSCLIRVASNDPVWNEYGVTRQTPEGVCGHVWKTGTTCVFQDHDELEINGLLAREPARDKFVRFQSGVCVPLFAEQRPFGTLLVCRENRQSLTPADLAFVDEVAQVVSYGVRAATAAEQRERAAGAVKQ